MGGDKSMNDEEALDTLDELDWIPAQRVHLRPGIAVRVKRDAFSGDLGELHNGRVGEIVSIGGGDVVIRTTDQREPELLGAHYSPWLLEMKLDDCLTEGNTR